MTDRLVDDMDVQCEIWSLLQEQIFTGLVTLLKAYCICKYDAGLSVRSWCSNDLLNKLMSSCNKCIKDFFWSSSDDMTVSLLPGYSQSFHTKELRSRLYLFEIEFYFLKLLFEPPFGGLG